MNFKRNLLFTTAGLMLTLGLGTTLKAQEVEESALDTLARSVHKLQDDLTILKKLKISGYIQAQFQVADSTGIASYAGGNFAANVDNRFLIRRGRIKFNYDNRLTQYVLQFDANQTEIRTKEAYVKFTEPWMEAVSLQMGIFDVPFGNEAPLSSSTLESPERGRMSQILLPNENDLGAMLTFQMPKTSKFNFLKFEAGVFNGTNGKGSDFDWKKDFISRLSISKVSKSEKIKYGICVSYYDGGVNQSNKYIYDNIGALANGNTGFIIDSASTNKGKIAKRQYMGADAQISFDFPFGITTLKAEYIQGVQPGTSGTSTSPGAAVSDVATTTASASYAHVADTYVRNFNGAYFYFIQNIFQTKHQIVVKYDWYDPNTKVSGDQIANAGTKTNATDIKYTTLGLGYNYKFDNNIKITLYYDMVTNETSKYLASKAMWKDIPDNVLTVRFQYKF
jgi:hypothetical protein